MTDTTTTARWRIVVGFLAIYLIWGSTYLAIRFTIETIPPLLSAGIRFLIGGSLLYLWARASGAVTATSVQWRNSGIIGLLLVVGGTGTVTWAEQYVPSGLAALLVAAMPFWMVLIDWLRPNGQKPASSVIAGLVMGFAGIVVLVGPGNLGGAPVSTIGAVAVLLATLSWASGSIYSRHVDLPQSRLLSVGIQMLVGGATMLVMGMIVGELPQFHISLMTFKSVVALLYLAIIGSLAFAAYVWLLKVSTPAKVSTYAFVNPVVAVIVGWAFAGEALSARTLIAAAVIVAAVAVLTLAKGRQLKREEVTQPSSAPVPTCEAE